MCLHSRKALGCDKGAMNKAWDAACECVRAPPAEQSPYMLQVRWKLGKGPSPGRKARPQKPMLACTYEPTTKKVPFSAVAHEIQLAPAAALPAALQSCSTRDFRQAIWDSWHHDESKV